jgi:hypothetical protein
VVWGRGVGVGGRRLASAPGAIRGLVAILGPSGIVPRLQHDGVLGTPPCLQAARDQPGPYEVLHKRGEALFRDHVQTHLVCSQTLLRAWVIDEEAELPMEPTPISLAVAVKLLHRLPPFWGHGSWRSLAVGELACPWQPFSCKEFLPCLVFPAGVCDCEGVSRFPWASSPVTGELNSRYGVARPPERLALCSFFFAPSFRRAATVGGRVSRLGRSPTRSAAEGAVLDAREPLRRILRSLSKEEGKP